MPTLNGIISGFVGGDHLSIQRTVDRDGGGEADLAIASGVTITRAWLTVKNKVTDIDGDAIFQKEITTSLQPDIGQIENDGTADADPILRFDLTPVNTAAIGTRAKHYDVQVLMSNLKLYTPERGKIYASSQVTQDQS